MGFARAAICEPLESRRLLTTYGYVVPVGHSVVYLQPDASATGRVQVRADDPLNGAILHTFTNTTGVDGVDLGANGGFRVVDQVPAAAKPSTDADGDSGVKAEGGADGTLEVDAGVNDRFITTSFSLAGLAILATDATSAVTGYSRVGVGIDQVVIRTNDLSANSFADGTRVYVPTLPGQARLTVDTGGGTYDRIDLGDNGSFQWPAVVKTGAGHDAVNVELTDSPRTLIATVDFVYAHQLGLGNVLNVHSKAYVQLGPAPGTADHINYVDQVNVTGAQADQRGLFEIDAGAVIGALTASSNGDVIITANTSIGTFSNGTGSVGEIEAPVSIGTFAGDGDVVFTGASSPSLIDQFQSPQATGNVTAGSYADVTIAHTSSIPALQLDDYAIVRITAHAGGATTEVLRTDNLTFAGNGLGRLDLNNNAMILDYASTSPLIAVRSRIGQGYDAGTWTGDGITSSAAAAQATATHKTALGYAEASSLGIAMFAGQSVDSTAVVVRYTWSGDANLDGNVDVTDFTRLAGHFNQANRTWLDGDFTYDGLVDLTDFSAMAANYNQAGYPAPPASARTLARPAAAALQRGVEEVVALEIAAT